MEAREILIANTRTQSQSKITTDATTLGELKAALDNEGIDYSGLSFTEGITKTTLLDDSSPLPQNVMYKGEPTNNLVILLTNTKKNIASGSAERAAVYQIIREKNLQEEVKDYFGRNFTLVSTADLWEFINAHEETETPSEPAKEECGTPVAECFVDNIYGIIKCLVKAKVFDPDDVADLRDLTDELYDRLKEIEYSEPKTVGNIKITNADLEDMIAMI